MTHEQKPESAEFRTLETQVSECARDLHASLIALEEKLYVEFAEAEARGAAEQRRKDAEGAEFRTLEVQVSECSADLRASLTALDEKLYSEFVEAEFRGAAWQRQSDAEDNEIAGWQAFECGRGWFDISHDERSKYGEHIRPLYTRPASVAMLEERVKELEGEMERRIAEAVAAERIKTANAFEEFVKHLACDWGRFLSGDGPVIMESIATRVEREATAIREGGVP